MCIALAHHSICRDNESIMKPLFLRIGRTVTDFVKRHPVAVAWLCGIAYEAYQISWMRTIKLAEVAPDSGAVKALYYVAIIVMATFLSTAYPLAVILWRRLKLSWREPRALWLIPMLWVAAEYTQSFLFSIITYGRWGRIGSYFSFGSPGYFLVKTPLVYLSRLGGLWILSAVVVFFLVAIAQMIFVPRNRLNGLIGLGIIIVLAQVSWIIWKDPHGPVQTVAAVQLANRQNVTSEDKQIDVSLDQLPAGSFDAIILPEYSHYFEFNPDADTAAISRLAKGPNTLVIDSYQERSARPFINYLAYHRPDGTIIDRQHKWFLAPGGEYLPYFITVPLRLSGNAAVINAYIFSKQVSAADQPEQPHRVGDVSYGALACSGVVSAEIYRGMSARGATILTNSGALDALSLSSLYHDQSEMMGIFHAVANARPFVQSARGSYTYAYDMNGRVIVRDTSFETKALMATVQTNDRKTLYTLWGDWVAWVSLAVVAGCLIRLRRA